MTTDNRQGIRNDDCKTDKTAREKDRNAAQGLASEKARELGRTGSNQYQSNRSDSVSNKKGREVKHNK